MRPDQFIIGFLIFTAFIIGGLLVITDLNSNYNFVDMDTSAFNTVYANVSEMYNTSKDMTDAVLGNELAVEGDQSWESMTKGGYKAGKEFIVSTPKIAGGIANSVVKELPIPPIFATITLIGVTLFLIFSLVYLVMRFQPR